MRGVRVCGSGRARGGDDSPVSRGLRDEDGRGDGRAWVTGGNREVDAAVSKIADNRLGEGMFGQCGDERRRPSEVGEGDGRVGRWPARDNQKVACRNLFIGRWHALH